MPGVEVLAVELTGPEHFTVFVDHPQGVDHALCARVTDLLRGYLDRYAIDVSSPGFERPLRKPAHFANAVGRQGRRPHRRRDRRPQAVPRRGRGGRGARLHGSDGRRDRFHHPVRGHRAEQPDRRGVGT